LCVVSFHLYIHPDLYMFIYIYWTECSITNETTRSCVLCLSTCTCNRILCVHIHPYTYIGLSVDLQIKQRNLMCCVFPLVHTSGYFYIYTYIGLNAELQIKPRDLVCCVFPFVYMEWLQSVGSLKL